MHQLKLNDELRTFRAHNCLVKDFTMHLTMPDVTNRINVDYNFNIFIITLDCISLTMMNAHINVFDQPQKITERYN